MNHLIYSGILSRIFPKFVAAIIAGKIRVKSDALKQLINGGMFCGIFPKFVQYLSQQYLREKLRSKVVQASGLWEFARSGRTTHQITPAVHLEWIIAVFHLKLWFIKASLKYGVIPTIKCVYTFSQVSSPCSCSLSFVCFYSSLLQVFSGLDPSLSLHTQWHCGLGRAHYLCPALDWFVLSFCPIYDDDWQSL